MLELTILQSIADIVALAQVAAPSIIPSDLLEMGAFGLLTLIMTWHGRIMTKVVDRALNALDKISGAMESIRCALVEFEHRLERIEEKVGVAQKRVAALEDREKRE